MTAPFLPDAPHRFITRAGSARNRSANTTPSPAADHSRTADTSAASPTFSIVIATYNYGHLIERAIQSVLHQTHAPHEIIVVDDGSTDDTAERMRRYADRVRYVRKENEGQSSAYNLGALTASADFVYILDADDELCPDALSRFSHAVVEARRAGRADGIFYGGYESVSVHGKRRIRQSVQAPSDPFERLKTFIERKLTGLQNGAFIIPRAAFESIRYPEDIRHNTDLVFIGHALTRYPATAIDAIVLRSHEHPMRSRKRRHSNIAHDIRPVDCLFNPKEMDARFLVLKKDFLDARLRSLGRMNYLAGDFANTRTAYRSAFRLKPRAVADLGSLKRWFVAEARVWLDRLVE